MIGPFTGGYSWLSNFYERPFVMGNQFFTYLTVEHYYQAMKADTAVAECWIRTAPTPGEAKKRGRGIQMRPGFERDKRAVMLRGLMGKFMQHEDLRSMLTATGDQELVEVNTWGDRYWGRVSGQGENWLGKTLMMTRELLS